MEAFTVVCIIHLTAFPLPENGWLWVSSCLTLEGDGSANSNHLVPWSHHKCWGHWRTASRMVRQCTDKQSIVYYYSHYNITFSCGQGYLKETLTECDHGICFQIKSYFL